MRKGFTIVELLIVVVVIAILAAVTIVAYNGITRRANETGVKSDLRNTATKLNMVKSEQGTYPTSLNDSEKSESSNNVLTYTSDGTTFCLSGTTKAANGPVFYVTHGGTIQTGACPSTNIVWKQIEAGNLHSIGVSVSGKVYTWGNDGWGQLGNGAVTGNIQKPTDISSSGALAGKTITQVAAGQSSSYALGTDGVVYAWGYNNVGQLGDNSTTYRTSPIAVSGVLAGKTVTQISVRGLHVIALTSEGRVYAWGNNSRGQLGDGTIADKYVPTATVGAIATKTITKIASSSYNGYAIASDNTVFGWGWNDYGEVGDQSAVQRNTPLAITGSFIGKTITQLSGGGTYLLALASDGTVFGVGANDSSQINDSGNTIWSPEDISGYGALSGKTVNQVVANSSTSHALTSTGAVIGWGFNASGQIGNNSTTIPPFGPVVISGALSGKTIVKIGSGGGHVFAIDTDGVAYGWGSNSYGQVGDDSSGNQRNQPVRIAEP